MYLYWNKDWKVSPYFGQKQWIVRTKDVKGIHCPVEPYVNSWEKKTEKDKKETLMVLAMRIIDGKVAEQEAKQRESNPWLAQLEERALGHHPKRRKLEAAAVPAGDQSISRQSEEPGAKAKPDDEGNKAEQDEESDEESEEETKQEAKSSSSVEASDSESSESSSSSSDSAAKRAKKAPPMEAPKVNPVQRTSGQAAQLEAQLRERIAPVQDNGKRKEVLQKLFSQADKHAANRNMPVADFRALIAKLEREFVDEKPKPPPGAPPPRHLLLGAVKQRGAEESGAGLQQGMVAPTTPTYGGDVRTKEPAHRSLTVGRSVLRHPRAPRNFERKIDWTPNPVHQVVVESFRHYQELWYQNPGAFVECESCGERVPQSIGRLQGALGQPQFAQSEFVCQQCNAMNYR